MKKLLLIACLVCCNMATASAQTVDTLVNKAATTPFDVSFAVPDGNYLVTVTLGNKKKAAQTVVRAESRRHYVDLVQTRKGQYQTVSFVVNKHNPQIDPQTRVKLKPRELSYKNWDDSLNLSFCGPAPAVQRIRIEPAPLDVTTVFLCGNSTVDFLAVSFNSSLTLLRVLNNSSQDKGASKDSFPDAFTKYSTSSSSGSNPIIIVSISFISPNCT